MTAFILGIILVGIGIVIAAFVFHKYPVWSKTVADDVSGGVDKAKDIANTVVSDITKKQ